MKEIAGEIAEEGFEKSADFIVDEAGHAVAVSQRRMIDSFLKAEFPRTDAEKTSELGSIFPRCAKSPDFEQMVTHPAYNGKLNKFY